MGAKNVGQVFTQWGHLPGTPFRLLVYMALRSLDADALPRYWGGRDDLARALGRELPPDTDDSPAAERQRTAAYKAVKVAVRQLVDCKAIAPLRRAYSGQRQEWALALRPAEGDQTSSKRGTETVPQSRSPQEGKGYENRPPEGYENRPPKGVRKPSPQGVVQEDNRSNNPPPAVGELQDRRDAGGVATATGDQKPIPEPKRRDTARERPRLSPPAVAARLYRLLPEGIRTQIPEHGSRRVLDAIAAECSTRTDDELAERIARRAETWAYRIDDADDPTAVAITIVRRGYACPDIRCEDHERLDTGKQCEHCAEASPGDRPAQSAPLCPDHPDAARRDGECAGCWLERTLPTPSGDEVQLTESRTEPPAAVPASEGACEICGGSGGRERPVPMRTVACDRCWDTALHAA